jgi:hypothetical protein
MPLHRVLAPDAITKQEFHVRLRKWLLDNEPTVMARHRRDGITQSSFVTVNWCFI